MLIENINIEKISKITGLSLEKIGKIKEQYKIFEKDKMNSFKRKFIQYKRY